MKIILPVLTLVMLFVIFSNSFENSDTSKAKSSSVTKALVDVVKKVTKKPPNTQKAESVIRKLAHFGEFAAFAFLLYASIFVNTGRHTGYIRDVLFCGLLCAVCDEYLQYFSKGRSPEVKDVLIDYAGVLTGAGICFLIIYLHKKKRRKKSSL